MLHKSDATYNIKKSKKPNVILQKLVADFAIEGCKKHDGLAQVGASTFWVIDTNKYEVIRK